MNRVERQWQSREYPRFPFTFMVTLVDKKGKKVKGKAQNISKNGFLFSPDPIESIENLFSRNMSITAVKDDTEACGEIRWTNDDLNQLGICLDKNADTSSLGIQIPIEEGLTNEQQKEFSEKIEEKIKFTRNKSFSKYLYDVLWLASQFVNSDIAFIGYVIPHPNPKKSNMEVIAISHSICIGQDAKRLRDKFLKREDIIHKKDDLIWLETNPKNPRKKSCMAYSYRTREPYLLDYRDDKYMTPAEKKLCKDEEYAQIDTSITAELTVPIIVDNKVRIIMNFETTKVGAPTFNNVTRELLQLFANKVADEEAFKKAIFKSPKSFYALLYHAAIHHIMGEYGKAAKEFETWREVQCRDIFQRYPFIQDVLFPGFKEFYHHLSQRFMCTRSEWGEKSNNMIKQGIKKIFKDNCLDEFLEYDFPLYSLLKVYGKIEEVIKKANNPNIVEWGEKAKQKAKNIHQMMIERSEIKGENPFGLAKPHKLEGIFSNFFTHKEEHFKSLILSSFETSPQDFQNFLEFYLHLRFLVGMVEITKIQEELEMGEHLTFEEFMVISSKDEVKFPQLLDFIITCSTLILWENVGEDVLEDQDYQKLSIPLILAYLYRGEAYLMLNEKQKAYNDFIHLERLVETRHIKEDEHRLLPAVSDEPSSKRAKHFRDWLKVLLKYKKGKVYFASFAHRMSLSNFCGMMEKYKEFKHIFKDDVPLQYPIVEAMLCKGKLFLDTGSFQRSLKWLLEALKEILVAEWDINRKICHLSPLAKRLLTKLIDKLEEFKHNAIIKKDELIDHLWVSKENIENLKLEKDYVKDLNSWEIDFKQSEGKQKTLLTDCLFDGLDGDIFLLRNAKLLSDLCNRIGFVLFLINLYPTEYSDIRSEAVDKKIQIDGNGKIDIAAGWIDWALKFNPDNGFARFNGLLIKFDREKFAKSSDEIAKNFETALKQDRFYRRFYPIILHRICTQFTKDPEAPLSKVAYRLSRYLLTYIDDLIKKPAETYTYLTREGFLNKLEQKNQLDGLYFLQKWSSWSPKLPRPRIFSTRGGGKLLVWKGKGIAIDPGFDFLTNLYDEGFSLEDIDAIVITHDHIDHTNDFDAICRLIKEYNEVVEDKKKKHLILLVNPGFSQKCSHYLKEAEDKGEVKHVYTLSHDTTLNLDNFSLSIEVLRALHKEQSTEKYTVGLMFSLKDRFDQPPVLKIGFTSDTSYNEKDEKFKQDFNKLSSCDIVVANISHATFRELKGILEIEFNDSLYQSFFESLQQLQQKDRDTFRILQWALWYGRDSDPIKAIREKETLHEQRDGGKGVLKSHLGISGINKVWENMKNCPDKQVDSCKLMILAEFREELGSFRYKLAQLLNKFSGSEMVRCYTSDVGMVIRFEKNLQGKYQIKMQCSFCKQDNALNIGKTPFYPYTFYPPDKIYEVCVKGDHEGIFYFCNHHLPGPKGQFLEKVDRFSLFTIE